MIPVSEKLIFMLEEQTAHEIGNNLQYRMVSSWAETKGLKNIAGYFSKQADGEADHAKWLMDLLKDANVPLAIPTIEKRVSEFASCEVIAQLYIETEAETTNRLESIAKVSDGEYNIGVQNLMQKMLAEQLEEEGSSDKFANLVKLANGSPIMLDLAMAE